MSRRTAVLLDALDPAWRHLLLEGAGRFDETPGRGSIDQHEHAWRCARAADAAGADDELVLCALLHDAARPFDDERHGDLVATMLRGTVSPDRLALLREHGDYQRRVLAGETPPDGHVYGYASEAWAFAAWDAASFASAQS